MEELRTAETAEKAPADSYGENEIPGLLNGPRKNGRRIINELYSKAISGCYKSSYRKDRERGDKKSQ